MNKTTWNKLLVWLLAAAMMFLLTGCGAPAKENGGDMLSGLLFGQEEGFEPVDGEGVCVVAARRANTRWPAALPQPVQDAVRGSFTSWYDEEYQKYRAEACIGVIVSDGRPTVTPLEYRLTANTPANLQLQIDDAVRQTLDYLNSADCAADDEGADLLAALAEARAFLRGEGTVCVVDSGITVSGYFDMTRSDITQGTVQQVVDAIDPAAFCDLSGIRVSVAGLGNCCDGQIDYRNSNAFRTRLEEVWAEILAVRCGAQLLQPIAFEAAGGTDQVCSEEGSGLPWVAPAVFDVRGESDARTYFAISANTIGFLPDSARFRDEALAQQTVRAAAQWLSEYLQAHPDEQVFVVGSIAKTSPGADQPESKVSAARAKAVAQLLQQQGIPADRLTVMDLGTRRGSWSAADEFDAAGLPDEAARQANRQVVLIPAGSAEAGELAALMG